MRCDIIIPIWNQLEFTRECVENLIKNTGCPYRLILIDNASDSATRVYLEGIAGDKTLDAKLIRNETNLGFVKAVNQGLRITEGPYVCVLNNDTVPAPRWLERMIEFAETHPDVGLINPQCDGHLDTPIDAYAKALAGYKGEYMEMNQCQGFCMLIKRALIDKIGILDEAFGIGGFDDTDYSMRAHLAGFRCAAIKDAYVYHRLHASFNESGDREDWVRRNQKIYYDKWGKHRRVGIAVCLDLFNADSVSPVLKSAYTFARNWSWVHIWINAKVKKDLFKNEIKKALEKEGLPPHQNIRIEHFSLPRGIFKMAVAGKVIERRLSPRMRRKRFDTVIWEGR